MEKSAAMSAFFVFGRAPSGRATAASPRCRCGLFAISLTRVAPKLTNMTFYEAWNELR